MMCILKRKMMCENGTWLHRFGLIHRWQKRKPKKDWQNYTSNLMRKWRRWQSMMMRFGKGAWRTHPWLPEAVMCITATECTCLSSMLMRQDVRQPLNTSISFAGKWFRRNIRNAIYRMTSTQNLWKQSMNAWNMSCLSLKRWDTVLISQSSKISFSTEERLAEKRQSGRVVVQRLALSFVILQILPILTLFAMTWFSNDFWTQNAYLCRISTQTSLRLCEGKLSIMSQTNTRTKTPTLSMNFAVPSATSSRKESLPQKPP